MKRYTALLFVALFKTSAAIEEKLLNIDCLLRHFNRAALYEFVFFTLLVPARRR